MADIQQIKSHALPADWTLALALPEIVKTAPQILSAELRDSVLQTLGTITGLVNTDQITAAKQSAESLLQNLADDLSQRLRTAGTSLTDDKVPMRWPRDELTRDYYCNEPARGEYRFVSHVPFLLEMVPASASRDYLELAQKLAAHKCPLPEQSQIIKDAIQFNRDGSLDPDSALTWMVAASAYSGYQEGTTPFHMLRNLARFVADTRDESQRASIAHAELSKIRATYECYSEFGRQVPVILKQPDTPREWFYSYAPYLFGHGIQIIYEAGIYVMCSARDELPLDNFRFFDARGTGGRKIGGLVSPRQAQLIDRQDVVNAVRHLKSNGFPTLRDVSEVPLRDLPHGDKFDRRSRTVFFGEFATQPVSVTNTFEARIFQRGRANRPGHKELIFYRWDVRLECEQGERIGKVQGGADKVTLTWHFKTPTRVGKDTEGLGDKLDKIRGLRAITFDSSRGVFMFDHPIKVPGYIVGRKERLVTVYGLQNYTSGENLSPLFSIPKLDVADKRFSIAPFEFSYSSKPATGVALNRHTLQFRFDPELQKLGFPTDGSGHNCLTDLWRVSIPLVKPTPDQFTLPQLEPIRGLQDIPRKSWSTILQVLLNERLDAIRFVPRSDQTKESDAKEDEVTPKDEIIPPELIGKFFKGPREAITLVGRWFISHCKAENTPYYVVDSPLYGDAAWIFRNLPTAEAAAKHFVQRSGSRIEVALFPDYVNGGRITHTTHWERRFADVIEREILRRV